MGLETRAECPDDGVLLGVVRPGDTGLQPDVVRHLDGCSRCRVVVAGLLEGAPSSRIVPGEPVRTFADGELVAERYRVLSLVGRGGMGDVYRAFDEVLKVPVALKTLSSRVTASRRATERIKVEVQLARRVSHPNVCRIFDIGLHVSPGQSVFFLTMEMLEGETLRDRLDRRPCAPDEMQNIALQVANALAAVHACGIVHRDFKPENVMLVGGKEGASDRVVVMDFGLALPTEVGDGGVLPPADREQPTSGTPAYMAPELRRGAPAGPHTDVYAFGMVLLEMLGWPPDASAVGVRLESTAGDSAWLSLARRCLAPEPGQRIQGFAPIVRELEMRRAPGASAPSHRRRRRVWIGALLVPALAAGLIGGWRARGHHPSDSRAPRTESGPRVAEAAISPSAAAPRAETTATSESAGSTVGAATSGHRSFMGGRPRTPPTKKPADGVPTVSDAARAVPAAEETLNRAEILLLEGNLVAACALGERLRADAAASPAVYRFLGKCYMRAGRPTEGRTNYRRYLQLASNAADAAFVRGIVGSSP